MPLLVLLLTVLFVACEGPTGPAGTTGFTGAAGRVSIREGTILTRNYRELNPDFASLLVNAARSPEPTVLFVGIENENGVFNRVEWSSVIWDSAWYVLLYDRRGDLVGRNYRLKFLL